jgi:hypothetical protein
MQRWSHQFCTLSSLSLSLSLSSLMSSSWQAAAAGWAICCWPSCSSTDHGVTEKLTHIDHAKHILLFYGLVGREAIWALIPVIKLHSVRSVASQPASQPAASIYNNELCRKTEEIPVDFDLFTKRRLCPSFSFCCLQVDFELSFLQVLDELILLFMRDVLAGCFDRELHGNCGRKSEDRDRELVWPFRFSLQEGAIEYLTPIVAGRVTAYIQELETLACAFVWRKTNFPFQRLMSRSHIRISDNRRPPWSGPARKFFFACSIFSEGNLVASLVQILEGFSCFLRRLFLLALLLWKEAASLVQMLEISLASSEACFLLALSSQRKAASSDLGDFLLLQILKLLFLLA